MKNIFRNLSLAVLIIPLSLCLVACAAGPNAGANGFIYNNTTVPNYASPTAGDAKVGQCVGKASTHDVLGLVSWGDAGVEKAAHNGGVTQIKTIDVGTYNILGLYTERTTKVDGYGEFPESASLKKVVPLSSPEHPTTHKINPSID